MNLYKFSLAMFRKDDVFKYKRLQVHTTDILEGERKNQSALKFRARGSFHIIWLPTKSRSRKRSTSKVVLAVVVGRILFLIHETFLGKPGVSVYVWVRG